MAHFVCLLVLLLLSPLVIVQKAERHTGNDQTDQKFLDWSVQAVVCGTFRTSDFGLDQSEKSESEHVSRA